MSLRSAVAAAVVAALAAACGVGDGSDIGPRLSPLPNASCRAVVLDDQGRGVVGAVVRVVGTEARLVTGRNGRGDFLAEPRGRVRVAVDGRAGAAVAGDTLGAYTVALTVAGDLPAVLHLPDLPDAAAATLPTGTQVGATSLTSAAGSVLTVPAGSSVGTDDGAASVTLRLGELLPQHLPGDLPRPAAGALLFGAAVLIAPADVTFTAPADLDVADTLGLGAGSGRLFRLDQTTGEWNEVAAAVAAAAGRILAPGAIAGGGLWCVAADAPATSVDGRVVDAANPGAPVPDALVRVDQHHAISDRFGRFRVDGVAATLADGSPRQAAIELFAGGSWLPVRASGTAAVGAAPVDAGDFVLDTTPAGNIRVQQVLRGRAESSRPARLSSLLHDVALATTSDAAGQALFEDVPADYFGFQDGRALDARDVFYGQAIGFLEPGRRWLDAYQFFQQRGWYLGSRRTRALVSDAVGGGPLAGAAVVQGAVDGQGLVELTREGGTLFVTRDFAGRATASRSSTRGTRTLVHAISIARPNGDHLEFPLQRVLRLPVGAFDRHGIVAGSLTGADPAREHALRATRRLSLQEWWDDVVDGTPLASSLPVDVDPAVTHGPFAAGVAAAGGNLAAAEFTLAAGVRTVQRLGLLADVVPVEGERLARDLPLDLVADQTFDAPDALVGLDPAIAAADLRFALALRLPGDRVVDVVRDVGGNVAPLGAGLRFTLPALAPALPGDAWLLLLGSTAAAGADTLRHDTLVTVTAAGVEPLRLPAFPAIQQPAAGATVASTGFEVQFTLPPGARFGTIELRRDTGTEALLWQAWVPPDATSFRFTTLPPSAPTPLLAGRSYTLVVSAWFGDGVVTGSDDPYRDLTTFLQSIGAAERGITQVARRSIPITTG